jgi:Mg-chelatase subunit ChlD
MFEPFGGEDLIREVQNAIRDFLDEEEISEDLESGRVRTGLVSFADAGRRVTRISDNPGRVLTGLGSLRGGGSSQLAQGVRMAEQELKTASNPGDDTLKLIIVYSDGKFCPRDLRTAGVDADIEVISIGVGRDFDRANMQQLATEREFMLDISEVRELARLYTVVLPGTRGVLMNTMTVVEVLSEQVQYVPDSAIPPPSEVVTRVLKWVFTPPTSPFTLTYEVEPLVGGIVPVSERAEATWMDSATLQGAVAFPDVNLNVLLPTPTVTPSPTSTSTATPTNTPEPEARYLPFLANKWPPIEKCEPSEQTVDIALVIDTSASMNEPTQIGGVTKLAAAIDAANGLIDLLKFPADASLDQAAVIAFNSTADVVTPLSGDAILVRAGLAELVNRSGAGTRIDHGLAAGLAELTSPRHRPTHTRAVILVTDGNQSGGSNAEVIAQADAVKAAGITLWTVGLGTDLDTALLQQAATSPDHFKHAPNAEELRLIYQEIARVIPCKN